MKRSVDHTGVSITWEELGEGDAAPLVLVHGFTGHRDDFREVRDVLAERRRLILPDLRGHGDSGRAGRADSYTFEHAVSDLGRVFGEIGAKRCHLLGHSMGGMLALRFALAAPERLVSLVLMNTSGERPGSLDFVGIERAAALARREGMPVLQRRIEHAERSGESARRPARDRDRWAERYWAHHRRRYAAMDPEAYAGFGRAMAEQRSLLFRLGEIRVPCLVVVGSNDLGFLAESRRLAEAIPNARLVELPDAAHHPHQENRDAWLRALERHLARAESTPN